MRIIASLYVHVCDLLHAIPPQTHILCSDETQDESEKKINMPTDASYSGDKGSLLGAFCDPLHTCLASIALLHIYMLCRE